MLSFTVPAEVGDLEKERLVADGIRNYFAFEARQMRRRLELRRLERIKRALLCFSARPARTR